MRLAAAIAMLSMACAVAAQKPTAQLDTNALRIGERAVITLIAPPHYAWPAIGTRIGDRIEVLSVEPPDTLRDEKGALVRQRITVTSFDSGYHAVPPFVFGGGQETAPLLLEVRTVPPDSVAMYPPRGILRLPFSPGWWLARHWTWLAGGAALLALALLGWWVARRRKPETSTAPLVEPIAPLHERVRQALLDLDAERLWQNGQDKAYHSRLSDILRGYVEERFGVRAMERTTEELLAALRVSAMPAEQITALGNLLRTADLVKFAKYRPAPVEHEQALGAALRFVETNGSPQPTTAHAHGH
jgi:hypothetical protein